MFRYRERNRRVFTDQIKDILYLEWTDRVNDEVGMRKEVSEIDEELPPVLLVLHPQDHLIVPFGHDQCD